MPISSSLFDFVITDFLCPQHTLENDKPLNKAIDYFLFESLGEELNEKECYHLLSTDWSVTCVHRSSCDHSCKASSDNIECFNH